MTTKFTVYVPDSRLDTVDVRSKLATLRWMVGGMTEIKATGSWIGERDTVVEPVTLVQFILNEDTGPKTSILKAHIRDLCEILKSQGEESVLLERQEIEVEFI